MNNVLHKSGEQDSDRKHNFFLHFLFTSVGALIREHPMKQFVTETDIIEAYDAFSKPKKTPAKMSGYRFRD